MSVIERPIDAGKTVTRPTGRLKAIFHKGGLFYGTFYVGRWVLQRMVDFLDRRLIGVEQRKGLVDSWTILSRRLTAADNRKVWNEYDWSKKGEEWTRSEEWKAQLIHEYIEPYFPHGSEILEVRP